MSWNDSLNVMSYVLKEHINPCQMFKMAKVSVALKEMDSDVCDGHARRQLNSKKKKKFWLFISL